MGARPTTDARVKEALFDELVAIGGKERTIRPDALLRYKQLLRTPAVLRRAGTDRASAALAVCANQVLLEAVAEIVSPETRKVAEVALCTDPALDGLLISERLHKSPGLTESIFKYRRRLAFIEIAGFLTRDVALTEPAPRPRQSDGLPRDRHDSDPDLQCLTLLGQKAADLHYAGLGAIFTYRLDEQLRASDIVFRRSSITLHGFPLVRYLFKTYVAFVYGSCPSRRAEKLTPCFADEFLERGYNQQRLPRSTSAQLVRLWRATGASSPIGPEQVDQYERGMLAVSVYDTADYAARDAYVRWHGWVNQPPSWREKAYFADCLTPIVEASGAFALTLAQHPQIDAPILSQARLMAHRAVATCYEFDEWAPVLGGQALRNRADAYFDSHGPALTERGLK